MHFVLSEKLDLHPTITMEYFKPIYRLENLNVTEQAVCSFSSLKKDMNWKNPSSLSTLEELLLGKKAYIFFHIHDQLILLLFSLMGHSRLI